MIAFKQHYLDNLQGRTFKDTEDMFHGQQDMMTFSIWVFLQDISASEQRRYTEDSVRIFKDILLEHYPDTRWSALLSIHSGILNGSVEIKSGAIGAITRLLNKTTGSGYRQTDEIIHTSSPEATAHRQAYMDRFPDAPLDQVDTPCSLDQFLSQHPKGTFPVLEVQAKAERVSSKSQLELLRQRMSA